MRKILSTFMALLLLLLLVTGCGKKDSKTEEVEPTEAAAEEVNNSNETSDVAPGYLESEEATLYVDILMDSGKHIVLKLDPEAAPLSVENFQKLVGDGFYNDLIFHRIISGFMIQGGDPKGDGTGDAKDKVKGEFEENGWANPLEHKRGVLSMARSAEPDSASCQFFICHADAPHLDGHYAAFGEVVYGMEEVDRIAELKTDARDFPETPPHMSRVFFVKPE